MERQEKIKKLVEIFCDMQYGDLMLHLEIEEIVGESRKTSQYTGIVNAASKKLLSSGKMIENVRGVGYRLVLPDEYTKASAKCVVSGGRRIDQGAKILMNAPVKEMSIFGAQTYRNVCDRVTILQASIAGATVEINRLSNRKKNPLESALSSAN